MHFSALPLALSLAPLALAQYGPPADSSTTTTAPAQAEETGSPGSGKVHIVTVGMNGAIAFSPNSVTAAVGDSVEWTFYQPEHEVVQSSFDSPCAPINGSGFSSGPITTTGSGPNKNVFRIVVNTTDPLWYHCGFPSHCQLGMVGVINPPADKTIEQFASAASGAAMVSQPSQAAGGIIGPAAAVESSTGSPTTSSASPSKTGNAGVESRGDIQWTLFALTGIAAVGIGSLIV